MQKINILATHLGKLKTIFQDNGFTILDAKRVFPWIHFKNASSFDSMTDLSISTRTELDNVFSISCGECVSIQTSVDGTKKALLKLIDGEKIETVLIPDAKRNTVCVSAQVGCMMGCKFCHTGTQSFIRNLTASEIMGQFLFWKNSLNINITNVVFMGMGEPFLNYDNVSQSIRMLLSAECHKISRHKITVSTCGIVEEPIEKLATLGVKLAISLHASDDIKRSLLMPINKKYNIDRILAASKTYIKNSNTGFITFEYLLLKNINDSQDDAIALAKLLKKIHSKVNLIIFNAWPNSEFNGSDEATANTFSKILLAHNIRTIIRKSRGRDILAACGQLKSAMDMTHNKHSASLY